MTDHLVQVIVLVSDLGRARRDFESRGFAVADGGGHPGRGTGNLIVAFGTQYLELLAVIDPDEAKSSAFGRPVVDALASRGPGLARWSLESSGIDAVGVRLGLPVERRERVRPDGKTITWRSVAVDDAWREPWRCSYMAWEDAELHPARLIEPHPNGATGFASLEVGVPRRSDAVDWMGGHLPAGVMLRPGAAAGPSALTVATPDGPMAI
jgi:hypothetical protein